MPTTPMVLSRTTAHSPKERRRRSQTPRHIGDGRNAAAPSNFTKNADFCTFSFLSFGLIYILCFSLLLSFHFFTNLAKTAR
jgi:hypothetical protein